MIKKNDFGREHTELLYCQRGVFRLSDGMGAASQ